MALNKYYSTGTVSVSNGSTAVTGSGTSWLSTVKADDVFCRAGYSVRVASVTDDTNLVLAENWPGTTLSGSAYEIRITFDGPEFLQTARKIWSTLSSLVFYVADSVSATYQDFFEKTTNGTSRVRLKAADSLTADRTLTMPDADGTILTGALGSTDNRLLRADGTGGVTAQGSAITVDDSGNMSNVGTLSTSGSITSSSASAFQPQNQVENTANDAFGGFMMVLKKRGSSIVQVGDQLGAFMFRGWDGSAYQNAAYLSAQVASASAGAVKADFQMVAGTNILTFRSSATANLELPGPLKLASYTVGTLPAAATAGAGAMAYVTDSNTTTFNATVASGGSNKVAVISDGTNWKVH